MKKDNLCCMQCLDTTANNTHTCFLIWILTLPQIVIKILTLPQIITDYMKKVTTFFVYNRISKKKFFIEEQFFY